jgi:hypothetical protein
MLNEKPDNPFLDLQRQRRFYPNRHGPSALVRLLRERFGKPRVYTSPWEKAWRAAFGRDYAGYLIGLDAWYPLRKSMTAAEFIARYVTNENRR